MMPLKWFLLVLSTMLLTSCKYVQQFMPSEQSTVSDANLAREAAKAAQLAQQEAEQAARAAKIAQQEAEQAAVALRSAHASFMAETESRQAPVEEPVVAPPVKVEKARAAKKKPVAAVKPVPAKKVVKGKTAKSAPTELIPSQQKAISNLKESMLPPTYDPFKTEEDPIVEQAAAKPVVAAAPKRSPASVPGTTRVLAKQNKESKAELEARFKRALRLFESKDEEEYVKMIIHEPDGVKRVREVYIQRIEAVEGEQRMLARVMKPFDLKGSSVLLVATKKTDDQWIYLPSSKQTRKVVVAEKKGAILGSELRYEDFNPSAIRHSSIDLLKTERIEGKNYDVFEVQIPEGTGPYEKAWVWIDPKSEMPIQIEYYTGDEKVKKIEFFDYYKVGAVWRPAKLSIKNFKNNRGTDIEISNVKINSGLTADRLTVEALSKSW